jgi:hypothetical protein
MDFYALLDDVLELLRQRGRVTYRALKRQFHLADDVLDDLKEELIKAQRVAVDENGDVLVWAVTLAAPQRLLLRLPSRYRCLRPRSIEQSRSNPQKPNHGPLRRSAASSRCSSVTWWTRPYSPTSSTPKCGARWCGPIKRPAPL